MTRGGILARRRCPDAYGDASGHDVQRRRAIGQRFGGVKSSGAKLRGADLFERLQKIVYLFRRQQAWPVTA